VRFFFPDSCDQVDPSFDFETETRQRHRVRQRDDAYAHELFTEVPYTGILVAKTSVDSHSGQSSRYTLAQRQRLYRQGIRAYFRLDEVQMDTRLQTLGDCGAFSYAKETEPPFSVQEVADFYEVLGFDYGVSVDHVIFDYNAGYDEPGVDQPPEAVRRQAITLNLAEKFLAYQRRGAKFYPVGVAQGWSPKSYAYAVETLQQMGFDYIGLGGMVPLKTKDILACLAAIDTVRKPSTTLHIFGVTRVKEAPAFVQHGVGSLDSTSPLRQAFMDDRDNYYTLERTYTALRVAPIEGNVKLGRLLLSGKIDQDSARKLESACMQTLKAYESRQIDVATVVETLHEYNSLQGDDRDRRKAYTEVLEDRVWEHCRCDICRKLGIHVVIFRGAERNRRRGFHNLYVFYQRLQREMRQLNSLVNTARSTP